MEIRPVGASLIHASRRTDRKTEGQMDRHIEGETDECDEGIKCFSELSSSAWNSYLYLIINIVNIIISFIEGEIYSSFMGACIQISRPSKFSLRNSNSVLQHLICVQECSAMQFTNVLCVPDLGLQMCTFKPSYTCLSSNSRPEIIFNLSNPANVCD
jgi:hypothetical protein